MARDSLPLTGVRSLKELAFRFVLGLCAQADFDGRQTMEVARDLGAAKLGTFSGQSRLTFKRASCGGYGRILVRQYRG